MDFNNMEDEIIKEVVEKITTAAPSSEKRSTHTEERTNKADSSKTAEENEPVSFWDGLKNKVIENPSATIAINFALVAGLAFTAWNLHQKNKEMKEELKILKEKAMKKVKKKKKKQQYINGPIPLI